MSKNSLLLHTPTVEFCTILFCNGNLRKNVNNQDIIISKSMQHMEMEFYLEWKYSKFFFYHENEIMEFNLLKRKISLKRNSVISRDSISTIITVYIKEKRQYLSILTGMSTSY